MGHLQPNTLYMLAKKRIIKKEKRRIYAEGDVIISREQLYACNAPADDECAGGGYFARVRNFFMLFRLPWENRIVINIRDLRASISRLRF